MCAKFGNIHVKDQAKATLLNQKTGIVGNAGRYSVFQEERDGKTVQAVYHVEPDGALEYRFHLPEGWYWDPLLPMMEGFGMIAFMIDTVDPFIVITAIMIFDSNC